MANKPVKLIVGIGGESETKSALKSIRQAMIDMETSATAAAQAGSEKRTSVALKEIASRAKALGSLEASIKKVDDGMARAGGRAGPSTRSLTTGTNTSSPVMAALLGGEGVGGMLKAIGVAAIGVSAFRMGLDLATSTMRQFSSFVINDVIKPGMELETKSAQMANNAMGQIAAPELMRTAQHIGLENNMKPMDIVGAIGDFQDKTGDPKMGMQIVETLAKIAKGKGQDLGSLTGLAAALHAGSGGKMTGAELQTQILALTNQGVKGGVPIGELARLGGRFTAPMDRLAGDSYTRAMEIGAVMQTAKPKIGTTDIAMSSIEGFMREAASPAAKQLSRRSWTKDSSGVEKVGDIASLIADVVSKTKGNVTRLHAAGFTEEGSKLVKAYTGTYETGFHEAKAGGATDAQATVAGAKAVEDFIHSMMTADASMESVTAERDAVMRTSGQRFEQAMGTVRQQLTDGLLPIAADIAESLDLKTISEATHTLATDLHDLAGAIKTVLGMLPKGTGHALYETAKTLAAGALGGPGVAIGREIGKIINGGDASPSSAEFAAMSQQDKAAILRGEKPGKPLEFPGLGGGAGGAPTSSSENQQNFSGDQASGEAASSIDQLGESAAKIPGKLEALSTALDKVSSSANELNRSEAFSKS